MFVDTHAHLTDESFKGEEEEILEKCREKGVLKIITSGFNCESSLKALEFAQKYEEVYASIGVYPENIYEFDRQIENKFAQIAQNKKVVAIGEIGLQYTDNMPSREKQKEMFVRQLELAHELKKPIVIHCREAYGDMIDLLKQNKNLLEYSGTFHCYGGSKEIAKEILKLGFYISVGGVSTFKNASNLKETIKSLPIDNLLLETDCPYLAPDPYRRRRNDPSLIPIIAENLALLKGVSVQEIEEKTTQNARRLFKT